MTTYRFNIELNAEQSFEFVQALLPRRRDLFAYWDSFGQPGRYGHIPYDADEFFYTLERWSFGNRLEISVRDILGLSIHHWAEQELQSTYEKIELEGDKNPENDPAFRGLKLIVGNMGLSSAWLELNSTNSFHLDAASKREKEL